MKLDRGSVPRSRDLEVQAATQPVTGDEQDLVAAVLQKDRKAAAALVDRYADVVYGYVRQRLAPRTDLVDDIVHDVFIAALGSLARFAGRSSLRSWLLGIARHKVEDYYRERLRSIELDRSDAHLPVSTAPRFEERLDHERQRDKTERILAELPETYGLVLLWRYWEKRSVKEMAAVTGRTEKAIERLLARARARFRKRWEAD